MNDTHLIRGFGMRRLWLAAIAWGCVLSAGCAAFHPIQGIPARYLPEEFRGPSRAGKRTIDLSLLKQTPPGAHRVDSGDVLGIYIEGVLGDRKLAQPVNIPVGVDGPPSFGFPIPVRDDGTISLPLIGPVVVRGKTIAEVEGMLKKAYTADRQFLNPENDRILVSLQRPRHYRVLVIRQESAVATNFAAAGQINLGAVKRGTGQLVNLPAYKNDVLHALAQTGGLPGLDAENAIYILRRRKTSEGWTPAPNSSLPSGQSPSPIPLGAEARKTSRPRSTFRAQSLESDYRRGAGLSASQTPPTPPPFTREPDFFIPPPAEASPTDQPRLAMPPGAQTPPPFSLGPASSNALSPHRHASPGVESAPALWPDDGMVPSHAIPSDDAVLMTPEQFGWDMADSELRDRRIVKIPVRLGPGETVDLHEQDVILEDGDIVFIESRDTEVFYTGGLLGGGQFTLPRDYDLNVLQAIAMSQGQRTGAQGGSRGTSSIGGPSALNGDVAISASRVIVLRYLEDGRMIPIEVDLYQARTDVAEQVIIQPGDYILLQYTKLEAIAAFMERHLLEGAIFGVAASQLTSGN